ncbi:MAG: hypothetical protein ACLGPM_01550 [Acidobacteriota bacterium]
MLLVLTLFCTGSYTPACAQKGSPATLPKDPAELFSLALARNGLSSSDVKPWHIRGHYVLYLDDKPNDQGVYEEWWAGPNRYKRSYTSKSTGISQTDYAVGSKLLREGHQGWLFEGLAMRSALVAPVPAILPGDFVPRKRRLSLRKVKVSCVSLSYSDQDGGGVSTSWFPTYCIDSTTPALRVSVAGGDDVTTYNQIIEFQNHYLAREIHRTMGEKRVFDLWLDTVETIAQVPANFPDPPRDASAVDLTAIPTVERGKEFYGYPELLRMISPNFPAGGFALNGGVEAELAIAVGPDGHVNKITIESGPTQIDNVVREAASQWVYQPLRVLGEDRPFETTFRIMWAPRATAARLPGIP